MSHACVSGLQWNWQCDASFEIKTTQCMFAEVNPSSLSKYCDVELWHPSITMFKVSSPLRCSIGFVKETCNYQSASCCLYSPEHISNSASSRREKKEDWWCDSDGSALIQGPARVFFTLLLDDLAYCNMPRSDWISARGQHNAFNPITQMTGWALPRRRGVLFCSLTLIHLTLGISSYKSKHSSQNNFFFIRFTPEETQCKGVCCVCRYKWEK